MAHFTRRLPVQLVALSFGLLFLNEYLIYYLQIAQCSWPTVSAGQHPDNAGTATSPAVRAMILADIHMLGPYKGHWADRLRREWQMHRAFQTAMTLHRPDVVFVLGDLFDEGQLVNNDQFDEYVQRFRRLFHVPSGTRLYGALGNHDVGFHYRMQLPMLRRFHRAHVYPNPANGLITVGAVNFVVVNSMAMEADGCTLCRTAEATLKRVAERLQCRRPEADRSAPECVNETMNAAGYSAPVLLQHFPTWRRSDGGCLERDESVPLEEYRERWEVLSERSSRWLGDVLEPRVVFSGHSHHYCRTRTLWGVDEWTVNSFSWRNNDNPTFLMATFTGDAHAVRVCSMPRESTVFALYALGLAVVVMRLAVKLWCGLRCWNVSGLWERKFR